MQIPFFIALWNESKRCIAKVGRGLVAMDYPPLFVIRTLKEAFIAPEDYSLTPEATRA